jgi:hypothetical protein
LKSGFTRTCPDLFFPCLLLESFTPLFMATHFLGPFYSIISLTFNSGRIFCTNNMFSSFSTILNIHLIYRVCWFFYWISWVLMFHPLQAMKVFEFLLLPATFVFIFLHQGTFWYLFATPYIICTYYLRILLALHPVLGNKISC